MIDPDDPSRLLDSPAESAGLRDALRAAAADVGSDQQVARLAKRLSPLLALGATGAAVGTSTAVVKGTATSFAAKAGAGALALIVAGGGAWLVYASSAKPPPAPPQKATAPVVQPAPLAVAPVAPIAAAEAPAPVASSEPALAAPKRALSSKPVAAAEPTEGDLLEQARSALKGDPATALARANEAATRFPRSALVQEREVIAIQALRKLGRDAEADQRAAEFSKAFPDSAFRRKLGATP